MIVCAYDNPDTMARECWQDGRLLCHYKAELFVLRDGGVQLIPANLFFFGANVGPWKTGQLFGDPVVMVMANRD